MLGALMDVGFNFGAAVAAGHRTRHSAHRMSTRRRPPGDQPIRSGGAALWKTVVDLGWTELATPDADGEFGPVELDLSFSKSVAPQSHRFRCSPSIGLAAGAFAHRGSVRRTSCSPISPAGSSPHLPRTPPGPGCPAQTMTLRQGTPTRTRGRGSQPVRAELIVTLADSDDGVGGCGSPLRRRGDHR